MKDIIKYIKNNINNKQKHYKNSNMDFNAYIANEYFYESKNTVFVVMPQLHQAQIMYDRLSDINEEDKVLFYPSDPLVSKVVALSSEEFSNERMHTIDKLISNEPFIVVTTYEALNMPQMALEKHLANRLTIREKHEYEINNIVTHLIINGYSNEYTVEKPGDFSLRGGILDIYPRNSLMPYRLDFFGSYLEAIKIFSPETQRSIDKVSEIKITPVNELFFSDDELSGAVSRIKESFSKEELTDNDEQRLAQDIEELENKINIQTKSKYIEFFNDDDTTILDFQKNSKVITIDKHEAADDHEYDISIDNNGIYLDNATDLGVYTPDNYFSELSLFYNDYLGMYKDYKINLYINNKINKELLIEYFTSININVLDHNKINIESKIKGSFYIPNIKRLYMDESILFNAKTKRAIKYRSVLNRSTKIRDVSELNVGDYVVHYDFGIGKFVGLKTMKLTGLEKDYLHIIYKDNEVLYVPMEQINLVLKYSSYDSNVPPLSKMGGKAWNNTKAQVKKKIKDYSDRLIKLYSEREEAVGYQFENDKELELEFANDFLFEETKDQIAAIEDTFSDMNKPIPMDRIIIGDVGFGKTEVAMRAAFKAVLNGKQVLYLVPTTVLARQHYFTFKERFEKYGVSVSLMNRFVSKKIQTENLERLSKGLVDIIIGTHRLLSIDVKFKNLGLLIVDEEQRFGVIHKERIKEIKVNVDTLTLTATPIPRTLQMSLMGIKSLSKIDTPPLNRYPIQTYVVSRDESIITEAIRREMARGGQTFYLFNKVIGMEGMVERIKALVPEASIVHAHGQMTKYQLEKTLTDFIEHKNDVLIATTIIETGIDIPNTNTIIIHDADKLGLSQLYQIRGRVGRSDKIAYAYLMFEPNKILKDESQKRLKSLEEFTALGSGYKIAMRDLSIRGAGDILGSEQSGFIDSVGIELYTKLLEDALKGKGEEPKEELNEVYAKRHIAPSYIEKDSVRIEIHKKIGSLNNIADAKDLANELKDRFGAIDKDLEEYIYEKLFNKLINRLGAKKVTRSVSQVKLVIEEAASKNTEGSELFILANTFKYPVKLGFINQEVQISFDFLKAKEHWLYLVSMFLDKYLNGETTDQEQYFENLDLNDNVFHL